MWNQATAWGYVNHDPFGSLVLPELNPLNERGFSLQEMKSIIVAAEEPYKTLYWISAELGDRGGEAFALTVPNLLLDNTAIRISQSVWHGRIQTVKSKKGNRVCEISPQLVEHLRSFLRTWRPNPMGLLFATRNGTRWDLDTVRKRNCIRSFSSWGSSALAFMPSATGMPRSWINSRCRWLRGRTVWASPMLEPQWDTHTQSVKMFAASRRTSGSS